MATDPGYLWAATDQSSSSAQSTGPKPQGMDPVTGAILSGGMAALNNETVRFQAGLSTQLSAVSATAANKTTAAQNIAAVAGGAVARWQQSVRNQRILAAGGQALEESTLSAAHEAAAFSRSTFTQSIAAAEQAGRAAAMRGFSGLSSNVADTVNTATTLQHSFAMQQAQLHHDQTQWAAAKQRSVVLLNTIRSTDSSFIMDNLDYTQHVAQQFYAPTAMEAFATGAINGAMNAAAKMPMP